MIHFIDESIYDKGNYIKVGIYYTNKDDALILLDKLIEGEEINYIKLSDNETMADILKWDKRIGIYLLPMNDSSRGFKNQYSFIPKSSLDGSGYDFFNTILVNSTIDHGHNLRYDVNTFIPRVLVY